MFDQKLLGTVEKDVFYTSDNDLARSMDIYYPDCMAEPWPVVISVPGGGWQFANKDWAWFSADLAKAGVLGISINYRQSPTVIAPGHLLDIKNAIRFLRANAKRFNLNAAKLGLFGHSAGGHLSALAALTAGLTIFEDHGSYLDYSEEVQAAVICSGPSTIYDLINDKAACLKIFGTIDETDPIFQKYSPMTHVKEDAPPFLIVHGSADQAVPISEGENLHQSLLKLGNHSEMLTIEGGGHGYQVDGVGQMDKVRDRVIPFLLKHLK